MTPPGKLRIAEYLSHIIDAINKIDRYTSDVPEVDFLNDEKTQDAVIRNFEIIGEACNNIAKLHPEFAAQHPEVPWGIAYEMRNALSHGYHKVDLEIVWKTIHANLPELAVQVYAAREDCAKERTPPGLP